MVQESSRSGSFNRLHHRASELRRSKYELLHIGPLPFRGRLSRAWARISNRLLEGPTVTAPLFLELFSGSGVMSQAFAANGFETVTVDLDPACNADHCLDITKLQPEDFLSILPRRPTVIWSSPDCTQWSYARGVRNEWRDANHDPLSEDAQNAVAMVRHVLYLYEELDPVYSFIENPLHGALKDQPFMRELPYADVAYCAYGLPYQKKTRIWGRFPPAWLPRANCSHNRHPNIKGYKDAKARSVIPDRLCRSIARSCVVSAGAQLATLEDFR